MPRSLIFAPCDNVLLGQDNSVSLIQVLTQIVVSGTVPDPLPENAGSPMRWFIFSQWEVFPEEVGVTFQQRLQIADDARVFYEAFSDFIPEAGKNVHRLIGALSFFPLIPGGKYRLRLAVRRAGDENPWQDAAEYPLEIIYRHIAVPA